MNRVSVSIAGVTALAFSQLCAAADWQLRIGPVAEKFNYTEQVTPMASVDTTEDGPLYGLSLKLARRIGQFEVEGAVSHLSSTVDFNSAYSDPDTGRELGVLAKDSKARITEASIRVARWLRSTNDRVAIYGGFGYRRWDRDVEDKLVRRSPRDILVVGSILDYSWPYAMAGAKLSLHKTDRMSVMLDLRVTKPIDPKVEIAFKGTTAPVTLDVGSEIGYRFEAPLSYKLTSTGGIEVVPFYERIKLKKSATEQAVRTDLPLSPSGNPVTSPVSEPASTTETYGLNINWLQEF